MSQWIKHVLPTIPGPVTMTRVKDHGAGCQQNVWNGELQTFNGRFALFGALGFCSTVEVVILLQQLDDLINPKPDLVIVRELGELQGLLSGVLELLLDDPRPLQRRLRAVIGDVTIDDRDLFSEAFRVLLTQQASRLDQVVLKGLRVGLPGLDVSSP